MRHGMTLVEVMIALAVLALATGLTMTLVTISAQGDGPNRADAHTEAIRKGRPVVTWDPAGQVRLDEPDGGSVEGPTGAPP